MDFDVFALDGLGLKYSVRDPIHGFIRFNEWEKSIIDHPWFQRLRRIRQLALTDYVFPGASHTRFEHSLGVMHLATRMFLRVTCKCREELAEVLGYKGDQNHQYGQNILRAVQVLRLAALLHDIGHGPFSHAVEAVYPPIPDSPENKHYRHEDYSIAAIEYLTERIDRAKQNQYQITSMEVANLLRDHPHMKHTVGNLWSLARTILNSQLDADKLDYLLRDSHHVGVVYGLFDLDRVIEALTFCMVPPKPRDKEDMPAPEIELALEENDFEAAEAVTIARHRMFSLVYLHKTRRIFDLMLALALPRLVQGVLPPPHPVANLQDYLAWHDVRVLAGLPSGRSPAEKVLQAALVERCFPRLAGALPDKLILRNTVHALQSENLSIIKDTSLADDGDGQPDIWVDTGARFVTYSFDEDNEIKLRPEVPPSDTNAEPHIRFAPLLLSERSVVIKSAFREKPRVFRVYCTDIKQRANVAKIIQRCGGTPWER